MSRVSWAASLCLFLVGCAAGPISLYEGADLPSEETSVLAVGGFGSLVPIDMGATVKKVDGKALDNWFTRGQVSSVRLLPGEHTATVSYSQAAASTREHLYVRDTDIKFFAKAGHTYILNHRLMGDRINFWIEDHGRNFDSSCFPGYRIDREFNARCYPARNSATSNSRSF
jgi:hypothetical protein